MIKYISLACVVLLGLGCDKGRQGIAYQPCDAAGRVTLDGMPLPRGTVTFVPQTPESAGGHPGIATIDDAGRYHLGNAESGRAKLLPPGDYVVTVVAMEVDRSRGKPQPKLAVPERYANAGGSPLRITLAPGKNTVDLPLVR